MTHSSSELPIEPVQITHLACGSTWDLYSIEWPPKVVVCAACRVALQVVGHDPQTMRVSFRRA